MLKNFIILRLMNQTWGILIFSCLTSAFLFGEIQQIHLPQLMVMDCLLPVTHPIYKQLNRLCKNPKMFQSPQYLKESGFGILGKIRRGFLVASHPNLTGYLIKKFQDEIPKKQQIDNYLRRIRGARTLSEFIKINHLERIVVPQKWLYQLPDCFSNPKNGKKSYALIVEKIEICNGGANPQGEVAKKYQDIDFDTLKELCIVVYYFRGLDSGLQNMPFTDQNKIAFIDTEHWENEREGFLQHVMRYLTPDRQEYALAIFQELRAQDTRYILDNK